MQGQLRHCGYCNGTLTANVDSLGNSAVKFGVVMHTSVGAEIYCGGRNVFDTFCKSRFGEKTADFLSETPDLAVRMQYFLQNNCEVRRYEVTNRGKKRTLTFDGTLKNTSAMTGQYFETEGALCLASEECYCAVAVVESAAMARLARGRAAKSRGAAPVPPRPARSLPRHAPLSSTGSRAASGRR